VAGADALLSHYGASLAGVGEPASLLASRFPLIYLFHRYALGAAINVIGSAKIPPSLVGDGQDPVAVWPAAGQREALQLVAKALDPNELEIPASLWKLLAPPGPEREDAERFTSSAGYLFSPQDGARAIADIVAGGLLDPQRMQRLAVIAHESSRSLSPSEVVGALVRAAFSAPVAGTSNHENADLGDVVQTQVAERLMLLAVDSNATPEVQAAALTGVYSVRKMVHGGQGATAQRLDHEITLFLNDPHQNAPKLKPSGAPPGPPV
jgi:hypothetical protein